MKAIQEAGGKAAAVKADVSKLDDVTSLFKEAAAAFPDEKVEVGAKMKARNNVAHLSILVYCCICLF